MYEELLKLYDKLEPIGVVAPPAHTTITPKIGILLGIHGNFMGARYLNETAIVPCTEQSEFRTSDTSSHLIHDNLSYVANMPGREYRFSAYMEQLENYVDHVDDPLAKAVFIHASSGLLLDELKPITDCIPTPLERISVVFGIPGMETTINREWLQYYALSLPVNGVCSITGKPDHIPEGYPKNLRKQGDLAKIFQKPNKNMTTDMPNCAPGYIASQKISHVLQWLSCAPDMIVGDDTGPMNNYVSLKEYAKIHGINPANVRQKILRGNLEAERIGNFWFLDKNMPYSSPKAEKGNE